MGTPFDIRSHIDSVNVDEQRRKIADRLQEDYSVFISYSHADKEFARWVTEMFDRRGIRYRIDAKELKWTQLIAAEVQQLIDESTHYLLILSDASAKSPWCAFECGFAMKGGKIVCVVQTTADVAIPPFAQPVLATADFAEVEHYFSNPLIDPAAVDDFIATLLGDSGAVLERFEPRPETTEGRRVWTSPDREAIERFLADRSPWVDYTDSDTWELVQIELGDPASATPLVLGCIKTSGRGSRQVDHSFSYIDDATAAVADPRKKGSPPVGVWTEAEGGSLVLDKRMPTVDDRNAEVAYGWACSRDFWKATLRRLDERLPEHSLPASRT